MVACAASNIERLTTGSIHYADCLFPVFIRLPETHARPSAVFVDELDAGGLKATPYNIERGPSRFVRSGF
jgi:hypothetical protein